MHRLYTNTMAFYMRLKHLQISVSVRGSDTNPPWILRDDCNSQGNKTPPHFLVGSWAGGETDCPPLKAEQRALREVCVRSPGKQINTCLLLFADCLAGFVPNDTVYVPVSLEHLICSNKILFI